MADSFILFAEMRTGSNLLEANLNALDGVTCHGEAFNPHFIGYPNRDAALGVTRAERDADPLCLLSALRAAPGLNGFRYFHDHDPRVLDPVMADPRCAKIVLTRNPLDSYLSWKIARATNQWKLTDVKRRKDAQVTFDAAEFTAHVERLQAFQQDILHRLQSSGQVAFHLAYEDLQDLAVLNGLAQWLGVPARLARLDDALKVQNPAPPEEKVSNPEEMARALADLDRFNLHRTPNFEPRRGPVVPSHVGAVKTPLLYLPVAGGPVASVTSWMAELDRQPVEALHRRMNQKQLRQWKAAMAGHRSFTVLRHPVLRAHEVFCRRILSAGPGSFTAIRETLRRRYHVPLPEGGGETDHDLDRHRAAFEGFLAFLQANLAGQTGVRVDGAWASQSAALSGFGELALPDAVLREDELAERLADLARRLGHPDPPPYVPEAEAGPVPLAQVYDRALEDRVAAIYRRDYAMFGFAPWGEGG